jgi:hypothetical protein
MTPRADLDVLQRVVRESGVDQTVAGPTWLGYVGALVEASFAWLRRTLPGRHVFGNLPDAAVRAVKVAAAVVVVLAVLAAVRAALARRDRRPSRSVFIERTAAGPAALASRGRAEWKEEIERRLRAGDMAGALEALWWWFARSLSTAPVDPAWTSGELLRHARRLELAPLALALDRLLYGSERPGAEHVRRFLERGQEALP